MKKSSYSVIGLMSGTSLDGLDMAYCKFDLVNGNWQFKILASNSIDYDSKWRDTLKNGFDLEERDLLLLDGEYGRWIGKETRDFIQTNNLDVDFIASHGHTIFHQPEEGITVQIGSGQEIANTTGIRVICDFRKIDVSLGGQGAPLVPIGDEYLFAQYRACVNLGGIANISFRNEGDRVAFDIGMANMLLNYIINQMGKPYDASGEMARSGKVNPELLQQLNELEYYELPYPKSTGYEWFLSDVQPLIDNSDLSVADKLATSVEHEAMQLGLVLNKYVLLPGEVLITGGGALNDYLIERIVQFTPDHLNIIIPDHEIINSKEAMVFALMGVLRLRNEVNCLKSVTGASKDSSGGEIFDPQI
jgi:anhydro-N-acetylmuramic acid kinase